MLLVTGAAGNSGRCFFDKLVEKGYRGKIRCIARKDHQTTIQLSKNRRLTSKRNIDFIKNSNLNVEFYYGNIIDQKFLKESLKGIKTVLHLAGFHHSINIIEIGKLLGVEWFICVQSTGLFSKYNSLSYEYKNIESAMKKNANVTILRPTLIYGGSNDRQMSKLINRIKRYKFIPIVGSGSNLFQPVHAKDLGDAYWKLLTSEKDFKGKQYNLSGNNQISYLEMLKLISLIIGKKNVFIPIPFLICIACVHIYVFFHNIYRWRERYPEKSLIVTVEQVYRMNEDKVFSWKKASDDFGYFPMTFEEGIRSQIKEL